MKKEKNHLIQCVRGLICFMVVQNHMWPQQNWFYYLVWGIAGPSMGLLLLISGYFMYTEAGEQQLARLKKKSWGTFLLTAQVLLFYYIVKFVPMLLTGNLSEYIAKYLAPGELVKLIFPNSTVVCGPMWYMVSLLYSSLLLYVLVKYKWAEKVWVAVPFLLFVSLCFSGGVPAFPSAANPEYARFFLLHGFPFVLSGFLFHQHQEKLLGYLKPVLKPAVGVLLYVLMVLEAVALGCNVLSVSSILSSFWWLAFALQHPSVGKGSFLEEVGTKDSVHIYLIHWCFTSVAVRLLNAFGTLPWMVAHGTAVVIWLLCIALSRLYLYVKSRSAALKLGV